MDHAHICNLNYFCSLFSDQFSNNNLAYCIKFHFSVFFILLEGVCDCIFFSWLIFLLFDVEASYIILAGPEPTSAKIFVIKIILKFPIIISEKIDILWLYRVRYFGDASIGIPKTIKDGKTMKWIKIREFFGFLWYFEKTKIWHFL